MWNYNSLFPMTGLRRHLWGTILALLLASPALASDFTSPVADFAKSIASTGITGSITFSLLNSSSLPNSDVIAIRSGLEGQLRSLGLRITTTNNAAADVRVTLSENIEGYLWVAEIRKGDNTEVRMIPVPRIMPSHSPGAAPAMTIQKALLWSGSDQILDATVDGNRLLVLKPTSVSVFSLSSGNWKLDQDLPLLHDHDFPRDLRGLIVLATDHVADLYLPGTSCRLTNNGGYAVSCRDEDDPWPISGRSALFNSARNYFTGALFGTANNSVPPFYSAATFERQGSLFSIFAGVDGQVRTSDGTSESILAATAVSDWGSDIAAIKSGCGSGTQLLVSSAGDDSIADSLRAFEFPGSAPQLVSAATGFPGPITTLWSHNGGSAITAITNNLQTGSYEAYTVSVTCNH